MVELYLKLMIHTHMSILDPKIETGAIGSKSQVGENREYKGN